VPTIFDDGGAVCAVDTFDGIRVLPLDLALANTRPQYSATGITRSVSLSLVVNKFMLRQKYVPQSVWVRRKVSYEALEDCVADKNVQRAIKSSLRMYFIPDA
jgi:hypothetical protein